MKSWNKNALECESCIFEKSHEQKNFKGFKTLVWYILIVGWETYDLWLTYNWSNLNIKSLRNVKFEIKNQSLKMFQLHKNWKMS